MSKIRKSDTTANPPRWAPLLLGATLALVAPAGMPGTVVSQEQAPQAVRQRQKLMEEIAAHAEAVNEAIKAGDRETVAREALSIRVKISEFAPLFPEGSRHPTSRAKREIWSDHQWFEFDIKKLREKADSLAETAAGTGDMRAAARMAETCKACHDSFREPEE